MKAIPVLLGAAALFAGAGRTIAAGAEPSDFVLETRWREPAAYFPTYLANGYFSIQSTLRGTDPALAQIAGVNDRTPGDVMRPAAVPSWNEADYFDGAAWLNSCPLTGDALAGYVQRLDLYRGELATRYDWVDGSRRSRLEIAEFVCQAEPHRAVLRLSVTPQADGEIALRFPLRLPARPVHRFALARLGLAQLKEAIVRAYGLPPAGTGLLSQILKPPTPTAANRSAIWYPGEVVIRNLGGSIRERMVWIEGQAVGGQAFAEATAIAIPDGLAHADLRIERDPDGVVLVVRGHAAAGRSYDFTKFVAVDTADWGGGAQAVTEDCERMRAEGFAALKSRHEAAWAELWRSDILIPSDHALQRTVHSDLFYLYENSTAGTSRPMAACGFSPNYYGHVFWDNDTWDFPVLLLLHPERAQSLEAFRRRTLDAALARARERGLRGAMYPWEADPDNGREATPRFAQENADGEIHVTADVAIAQWQYYCATGDRRWLQDTAWPVIRAVAEFWASRVTLDPTTGRDEVLHVTSPDEAYTNVNDDGFTNAAARKALRIAGEAARSAGARPDPAWARIAAGLVQPFSAREGRHLDFDPSTPHDKHTWMGSVVPCLALPSIDVPMPAEVRRNDFRASVRALHDFSPDANEMLVDILSVEAADLDDGASVDHWLRWKLGDFLKPPYEVRSETPRNNTAWILATSSGYLQNFLFGITGLRIAESGLEQAYVPCLPDSLPAITITGVHFRGRRMDISVRRSPGAAAQIQILPSP